jgi:hypothetical protein
MRAYVNRACLRTVLVLLGLAFGALTGLSQQPAAKASKSANKAVQEITLPEITPEIAPGPNLETYEKRCLLCHSNRYVAMQPRFSRTVWEKEVKKMVDAYGALIPPPEQQEIVEYLVAIRGPLEGK